MDLERGYKKLKVWQDARRLANLTYDLTAKFPKEELFGLSSQMRRAAISIISNIAEGNERHGKKEFIQFIGIARGSLAELESQAIIANDRKFINDSELEELMVISSSIAKMLWKLRQTLES